MRISDWSSDVCSSDLVVTIPTNLPVQRIDEEDEFYKNTHDKFRAIAKSIKEHADKGQPVLVGTVSIEKSELLSEFLHQEKVKHNVLHARLHERDRKSTRLNSSH